MNHPIKPLEENLPRKISRFGFLKAGLSDILGFFWELCGDSLERFSEQFPDFIRPPGAKTPEEAFLNLCSRCNRCAQACPYFAIQRCTISGSFFEGTPLLKLRDSFCRMCHDYPCIQACPTGALSQGGGVFPEKAMDGVSARGLSDVPPYIPLKIGLARMNSKLCLRAKGKECRICLDSCSSYSALEISQQTLAPQVLSGKCTGCGACEGHCPVSPEPAIKVFPLS